MNDYQAPMAPRINGHMIALTAMHSIAVYDRDGSSYIAEFRNGQGTLACAVAWFRSNERLLRSREGRHALQFCTPLDAETLGKIERLHAEGEARHERMLAFPRWLAAAVKAQLNTVRSRLRGAIPM